MPTIDYDRAIAAHSEWKRKLVSYLQKPDGSLKATDVGMDNRCVLGQWIYAEGTQHAKLPAYAQLKSEHARFHKAAAEIIKKIEAGQTDAAKEMLDGKSEFAQCAAQVILAIGAMRDARK